jgi:hypothetical protein
MTRSHLLNRDQARHLEATLAVLTGDLDALRAMVREQSWGAEADRAIAALEAEITNLLGALGIADRVRRTSPAQQIAAVCGVWRARLPELRAGTLKAYGTVHGDLPGVLDPHVERLLQHLERLAAASRRAELE